MTCPKCGGLMGIELIYTEFYVPVQQIKCLNCGKIIHKPNKPNKPNTFRNIKYAKENNYGRPTAPEICREVLSLRAKGMTYARIGEETNLSYSTVRNIIVGVK